MVPVEALRLDGRWLGLSVEGRDIGFVSFRAERVGRGLEWTRSGIFGRIRLAEPSIQVEEEHWSLEADGGVDHSAVGWDEYLDQWDPVDFLDREAGYSFAPTVGGANSQRNGPPYSVRWLTEAEKRGVLARIVRTRRGFDTASLALAEMLQAWDVLGVYIDKTNRPDDDQEYDDLVEPMRAWLEQGAEPSELSKRLTANLRDDYGLSAEVDMAALDFATRVHRWWHSLERS